MKSYDDYYYNDISLVKYYYLIIIIVILVSNSFYKLRYQSLSYLVIIHNYSRAQKSRSLDPQLIFFIQ